MSLDNHVMDLDTASGVHKVLGKSSPPLHVYNETRGRAGAPRMQHGVGKWKARGWHRNPSPASVPGGRQRSGPFIRVRGLPRRRPLMRPDSALLTWSSINVVPGATGAFCDHLDVDESALTDTDLQELEHALALPSPIWSDNSDSSFYEDCEEILALFEADTTPSTEQWPLGLMDFPLQPSSVTITRMEKVVSAQANEEGATTPTPARASTPPTPSKQPTTHLVPFDTLARWLPTPTTSPRTCPDSPLLTAPLKKSLSPFPSQRGACSTYVHDAAAAQRGPFKWFTPFHSLADRQQLARMGERLWCSETTSAD